MDRDPRYDILFEPVKIGPVTAKNRFYQVPHYTGMGYMMPKTLAAMREVKAEGGWGVVCTEYCSIHASSDDSPYPYATLWDDEDVKAQALMVEKVHRHGALAGVQLWYGGGSMPNLLSREVPLDMDSLPSDFRNDPVQSQAMDKKDIRKLRRWQVDAARRAVQAGFDIVYVYATHGYLLSHFLSADRNRRIDEYGGILENRVRLVREMIEDTLAAVGHKCAVAVRFSADGSGSGDGIIDNSEQHDMLEMLADLPDLWDINITDYSKEMGSSRFVKEAALEDYVAFVKQITAKPVVTVGRFTSPDTMVRQVKKGMVDFIGAARPSIADPFIPQKIRDGRIDDIRECIGCNICYAHDARAVPIRCTQNPTMGEEWRRGWHPEDIAPTQTDSEILVVGAGPAGLEAARALGQRGYAVTLAEASTELGGRVAAECRLPGLAEWRRVIEYRIHQIKRMTNVDVYLDSRLTVQDILSYDFDRIILATGAFWRRDGVGRWHSTPVKSFDSQRVFTPDDIMADVELPGPVMLFDDDHYYMGAVLAEKLQTLGLDVTLVTSAGTIGEWSFNTEEQMRTQRRLLNLGVDILTGQTVNGLEGDAAEIICVYTGKSLRHPTASLVTVTARKPQDALYRQLASDPLVLEESGIKSIVRIGDCRAPGIIAAAVYAGHRAAREMDAPDPGDVSFRRERVTI
ncbi:Histamine dehydrogenase [Olavius algarvensis Delta 1 endosymbiont]|nr:Histamine dehydrogenase [Olavius algarvensis Delta 1 endosymbiont]